MQRAAHQVHLTQPAISKIVRELERCSAHVVQRSKRGGLTECGRAFNRSTGREHANDPNVRAKRLQHRKGVVGSLRIGVLPVVESPAADEPASCQDRAGFADQIRGTRPALISFAPSG
jgi:DNA-binding transcriptional LysR family regulator